MILKSVISILPWAEFWGLHLPLGGGILVEVTSKKTFKLC